jgi:DNA-binding Lrp family transcriptional regulator
MSSLAKFFNIEESESIKGIAHKNNIIKRNIIAYMAVNGDSTLSELTRELHISVPTMTKLVQELVDDHIVIDLGKVEAAKKIEYSLIGTNTGNIPLIIHDIEHKCNCIDVKWNKRPIKGGERDTIRISFKSKQKGAFYKILTIKSNAGNKEASVKGEVVEKINKQRL